MTIGEKIKTLRTKKGLTQKQLGDLCGMADSAIRRYENGRANPKIETLQKIATALEVNIGYTEDGTPCFFDKILENTGTKTFSSITTKQKEIYKKIAELPETTPDTIILDLYHELNDIDFKENTISITKTYYRVTGKDLINPPKTAGSERVIIIPEFLAEELREYVSHLYKPDPEERLFNKRPQYVRSILRDRADRAGVKQIRVHDLRHSHASMLINLGANPVLAANRLGHESADITLKIYSHLFPSTQSEIVNKIKKVQ